MGNQIYTELERFDISNSELQRFNTGPRQRNDRVQRSIAREADGNRSTSLESLRDLTRGLLEMDREALRIILESNNDVRANKELLALVEEYFETGMSTLDLCVLLEKNMGELRAFRSSESPFGGQLSLQFRSAYARQVEMQHKLSSQQKKLDKKLQCAKGWINISLAIRWAVPLISAVVAAAWCLPVGAIGRWFESRGCAYEHKVRARRDLVRDMYLATFVTLKDLGTVRVLVDRLEGEMDRMVRSIEFRERHPAAVGLVVQQIRRQQAEFMAELEEFQKHVDICGKGICRARTVVLQRIIHRSSPSEAPSSPSDALR